MRGLQKQNFYLQIATTYTCFVKIVLQASMESQFVIFTNEIM